MKIIMLQIRLFIESAGMHAALMKVLMLYYGEYSIKTYKKCVWRQDCTILV